jgi:hypothetical protein
VAPRRSCARGSRACSTGPDACTRSGDRRRQRRQRIDIDFERPVVDRGPVLQSYESALRGRPGAGRPSPPAPGRARRPVHPPAWGARPIRRAAWRCATITAASSPPGIARLRARDHSTGPVGLRADAARISPSASSRPAVEALAGRTLAQARTFARLLEQTGPGPRRPAPRGGETGGPPRKALSLQARDPALKRAVAGSEAAATPAPPDALPENPPHDTLTILMLGTSISHYCSAFRA